MSNESRIYLPPREQLFIAAKVNRLCETDPENFDPNAQLQDAKDIVLALHPRVKPSGKYRVKINYLSTSSSTSTVADTGIGNMPIPTSEQTAYSIKYGVNEYRIGTQIATKRVGEKSTSLLFRDFRDNGAVGAVFDKYPPQTIIEYKFEPEVDLLEIRRHFYQIQERRLLWLIPYGAITVAQQDVLWKKESANQE